MSNLDTQCKNFNVVLNIPFECKDFERRLRNLNDALCRNLMFYASIKHDLDVAEEGIIKTIHYHYVIICASRKRISTMLYFIADALGYQEDVNLLNTIQVDKCDSVPLAIQYLIHKNNKEKYQYDASLIDTNFTEKELEDYMKQDVKEISTRYLYDLVKEGKTDVEIMFIIGVGRYHLFRGAINDIRYAISRTPQQLDNFIDTL